MSTGGRLFSIFLMIGGVGLILYTLTVTVQTIIENELLTGFVRRRRMGN